MSSEHIEDEKPESASDDFYVENECCTACGVPQHVAPDLVGWTDERQLFCYWKTQPKTPSEMENAFAVFEAQELGCHRYRGPDPKIQARIGIENCDHPVISIEQRGAIQNATPRFESVEEEGFFQKLFSKWMRKLQ